MLLDVARYDSRTTKQLYNSIHETGVAHVL